MNTVDYAYTKGKTKLKLSFLGSGGEGSVYEIVGYPNRVAKIYHDESNFQKKEREAKINAMVAISQNFNFKSASLSNDIAWPLAPLYDVNGNFIGFGMDRIPATTELDDLYVYPTKNNATVTIKDRVTCLISLCDVIERLHKIDQVFGDFNPNNIKIKSDWTVSFVDADSYHVNNKGNVYRCVVCAPGYVAPEVIRACKGTTYAQCKYTTFTKETDRFALAIHIFRMLMNGCHPFTCERHVTRVGSAPAPKSTDKRVETGETPFFKSVPNCVAPQYAPDINSLPLYLRDLFRKAFIEGHTEPSKRPSASEWKRALIKYNSELIECKSNHLHFYWKGDHSCPYCEADRRYNQKIGLVPAKSISKKTIINTNNCTQSSKNKTNTNSTYKSKKVASTATAVSSRTNRLNSGLFWSITLTITIIMQVLLGLYALPEIYSEVFDNETIAIIGVIGSLVSGIVGSILFNCLWAPGKYKGSYSWWEYLLSVLTAFGFTVGFGVVMGLVILIAIALFYLLVGAAIIAIIIGILSGG